ncbi:hypothetical protein Lser_V15G08192 [Lactuca serriola]
MLVLAPTACILSEIALFEAFDVFARSNKFYVFSLFENTQNEVWDGVSASTVSMENSDKKRRFVEEKTFQENQKKRWLWKRLPRRRLKSGP